MSFQKSGPDCIVGACGLQPDRHDVDNNNAPAGEKTGHSGELDLSLKKTQTPSACPRYSTNENSVYTENRDYNVIEL